MKSYNFIILGNPVAQGRPRVSEDTRRKMSQSRTGKRHTEESKLKMSLARIGKPFPHAGIPRSEECRLKLSIAHKGKRLSAEHRAKIGRKGPKNLTLESRRKLSDAKKGPNSSLWRGGKTHESKTARMSLEYRLWREAVFARDNFTCQKCGKTGGRLDPHHIFPFADYPHLRFDVNNGQTLCRPCHRETDSYGRGLSTRRSAA